MSGPRLASARLAGAITLGLLVAGCVPAQPVPARTATLPEPAPTTVSEAPTATPTLLLPSGVPTPRPGQEVQVTDHFVIYYTAEVSPTHVANVARYLEAAWRDIPPFLGLEPPSRVIRVYMGLGVENSYASPAVSVIVIEPSDLREGYKVVPHEFTHVLIGGAGPQWMKEGLAMYVQERFPAGQYSCFASISMDSLSIALLRANKWVTPWEFPLGQPNGTCWADLFAGYRAYWESGSFVKYLIETYGVSHFWEMYKDPSGWLAAEEVYGKHIDTLIEEWRQRLASSTIPPEDCAECIASFLDGGDLSMQFEQTRDRLSAEAGEQVSREFSAMREALCRKDAQAMRRHLETVRELLQAASDE